MSNDNNNYNVYKRALSMNNSWERIYESYLPDD
jgi:hypothetical protein